MDKDIKLLCIELDTVADNTNIYNKIKRILKYNTILEEGKCETLSEEDKQSQKYFFQYCVNLNNCYYIKYINEYTPNHEFKSKTIFDNYLHLDNYHLRYQKIININLMERTKLLEFIKQHCKALYKFNIGNNIYSKSFKFIFWESTFYQTKLNNFIEKYNENEIYKHQDLLILQFMIYNLYNYKFKTEFLINFESYYSKIFLYNDPFDELIKKINNQEYINSRTYNIFYDYHIEFDSIRFKFNMEHKIINYFAGDTDEY